MAIGLETLDILARIGKAATCADELARVGATSCAQLRGSAIAAVVLAPPHGEAVLHVHSTRAASGAQLTAIRHAAVKELSNHAMPVDQRALVVTTSGEPTDDRVTNAPSPVRGYPIIANAQVLGALTIDSSAVSDLESEQIVIHCVSRIGEALERLLREPRGNLPELVESMADGLIFADRSSDQVLINPAARRLLGIGAVEEINQSYLKERLGFYPFDLINVTSKSDAPLREEVAIGDTVLHSVVSAVRGTDGDLLGVVVVLRDLTEAKALAQRQREFVSIVSHELRTPLTSITGSLEIALSEYAGRLSSKQRRYLTLALESCGRLNSIVDDLLDVARSEEGRMPVRFTPLALDALARDVVERYRPAAQAKGIEMRVHWEDASMRIAGDADRLTQVLNNLLSNALKFTPRRGSVKVEIFGPKVVDGHVGVSVFNEGEPIPEQARERIFEKFEQVHESSTRKVGGTGLGLAISRAIVEAHHGRIWVESHPKGTKFVLTLPVAPSSEDPVQVDLQAQAEPACGAFVLIVDSEVHSSYLLKGILMAAGYRVEVRENPADALTLARQSTPDLVVVAADTEVAQQLAIIDILRHDPETSKCAVLGLGPEDHQEDFLNRGAHQFVQKPVAPTRFLDVAARIISESKRTTSARVLVVDDDLSIRIICREVLESGGYAVRTANDGAGALLEAKRFRPDVILLDVMMPEIDGFATAEQLRSDPSTAMTPVVFLSARGATEDKLRAFGLGAEDYIEKPFVAAEMLARVKRAFERRERELGASPTTQLPGSATIEAEIEKRLGSSDVAFCYLDLDNLKAFNDYYGYAKADGVIRQTGSLVRDVIGRIGSPSDFIGHIAGDDFVFITAAACVDRVCQTICDTFDQLIPLYYNRVDRERGTIETKDRYGVMRRFPIMGVSIAAVTRDATSYSQLAASAARGKKLAKESEGSAYVRDDQLVFARKTPVRV